MSPTRKNKIILPPLPSDIIRKHRKQLNKINRTSSSRTRKTLPSIGTTKQHRKIFGHNKLDTPVIKKATLSEQFKTQVNIGIQQATSSKGRPSRNKKPNTIFSWSNF